MKYQLGIAESGISNVFSPRQKISAAMCRYFCSIATVSFAFPA
jgi:hypothetical protein